MTPQEALDYINGARFANYSGQIVERRDGRDRYIVCEIGCNCSEIPGKISDEYGEALVTLLNSVEALLAQQGTFTRMIAEVCDHNEILHNSGACCTRPITCALTCCRAARLWL